MPTVGGGLLVPFTVGEGEAEEPKSTEGYPMAFPAVGTEVPALQNYQLSFLGYTFGFETPFELTKLEGIDMPVIRSGDAGRPRDQGLFVGLDVLGGREITITGQLRHNGATSFREAWTALAGATVPGGNVQEPLYLSLPGFGTLVTLARVRKRQMPIDITFTLGQLADVTLLFSASDPRWYSTPTLQATVSPPGRLSGFSFLLTFPLEFGGGSEAGALSIENAGDIETRPLLIVEGPCENPSITNATAEGSPNLTFDLTMAAGDKLIIDTDMHTATYFTAGTTIGATRLYTLVAGSEWFVLEPGVSTIQFWTSNEISSGTLTVQWASAYIL